MSGLDVHRCAATPSNEAAERADGNRRWAVRDSADTRTIGGSVSIESEVQVVAEAFDKALLGNDATLIAGFMTDDWVYVDPKGLVAKADLISWIASGRLAHHTMEAVSPERVVEVGGALLVTSRRVSTGLWEGEAYTADEWISDIWVRSEGSWRLAFSQKSPV